MQKVEGVDSVRVSLKEGLTVLELRAANKVTLAQLRTAIKNNGFVSKDAHIIARGETKGGGFEISGTREQLPLSGQANAVESGLWRFVSPAK